MKISQITPATVERWIGGLQEKGLKRLTVKHMTVIFNQIMAYAVRHKLIDNNPVRDADRPRKRPEDEMTVTVLNPEQIRTFLGVVHDEKEHALFMTAVMTGARKGEIMGLRWSDIDYEKKQIYIRRTFNHGRFFAPKTRGSIRAIDCPPALITELRKWKIRSGGKDESLIFSRENGEPLNGVTSWRHFKNALQEAGCPEIRFHDLRHTYASLLIAQGENIKYIQTQLGHATPMMTLNVYSHLMKPDNQEAALRLEKAILG